MQIYSTTLLPAIPSDIAELYPLPDVSFPSFEKITAGTLWLSSLNQGKQLLQERCVWAILCLLQRKCLYLYDHCLRVQYLGLSPGTLPFSSSNGDRHYRTGGALA